MSQGNLKKNYVYQLLYQFVRVGTPLITAPYISRVLGVEGIGVYSYTASILAYFSMFAALGTSVYGARTIAQCRDDKTLTSKNFWEIELMTILTSMASIIAWLCWAGVSKELSVYFFALTPHLFASMFNIVWFYKGLEKIGYVVRRDIFFKLLGVAYLFIFVRTKDDLITYIFANAIISMVGSLSMWLYLPKLLVKVDWRTFSLYQHLKETIIYFIPTISISVYTVLDKTLIGVITNDVRQNGFYEQANKIIKLIKSIIIISINSVITVRNSYLFANKRFGEAKERIEYSLNYILFLGYGAMFGLCGVAKNFVPVYFGDGYEPVIDLLCLMSPLIILIGISNCLGALYYTPSGRRGDSTKYIIIGAGINLIANLILIPGVGTKGAVVASLIAECFIAILYVKKCNGFMTFNKIWSFSWKRLLAGMATYYSVIVIGKMIVINSIEVVLLQILAGVFVYSVILLLMKDFIIHEMVRLVRSRWQKRSQN